jgi:hypothetical protein
MADLPGGASGLLCLDYKGKGATTEVYRIDPGPKARAAASVERADIYR